MLQSFSFRRLLPLPAAAAAVMAAALLTVSACRSTRGGQDVRGGWETASPQEVGLNAVLLEEMEKFIREQNLAANPYLKIDAILIVRHGKLAFERYYFGYDENKPHAIASCTKSLSATAVGIALQLGHIDSLDRPISDFLAAYRRSLIREGHAWDDRKDGITLRHLLTMTSGLEPFGADAEADADRISYSLSRPLFAEPGRAFKYASTGSSLLAPIITGATGRDMVDYLDSHLFRPLGIDRKDVIWPRDARGIPYASGGAAMRPRDMAKIGQLYLNEGVWNGERILPEEFVRSCGSPLTATNTPPLAYGYQFWVDALDGHRLYFASGYESQHIVVAPHLDMVAVAVGRVAADPFFSYHRIIKAYALASALP
jgi:CubicO group peptidase (beta-lactamase class C family)